MCGPGYSATLCMWRREAVTFCQESNSDNCWSSCLPTSDYICLVKAPRSSGNHEVLRDSGADLELPREHDTQPDLIHGLVWCDGVPAAALLAPLPRRYLDKARRATMLPTRSAPREEPAGIASSRSRWTGGGRPRQWVRVNHLSNTTCLTHVFFKRGESCSQVN